MIQNRWFGVSSFKVLFGELGKLSKFLGIFFVKKVLSLRRIASLRVRTLIVQLTTSFLKGKGIIIN